jgi:cell division inhibitor SulA
MLSTLIKTTQTTSYFVQNNDTHAPLVNVHYQENNYQALLEYIQKGEDHGWILFLAPPGKPNVQFLQKAGIDKSRVLMIDSSKIDDNLALLSTLLKSSNYSTVVVWVNVLSAQDLARIKRDAEKTNTGCFVYCKQ